MKLELVDCDVDDLAAAHAFEIASSGAPSSMAWLAMQEQRRGGICGALRDQAGETVLVGGFYPVDDGFEAWFAPTERTAAHLLTCLRLVRLTLGRVAYRGNIRVAVRTAAGSRIAALCGGSKLSTEGATEIWRWAVSSAAAARPKRRNRRRRKRSDGSWRSSHDSRPKSTRPTPPARARPVEGESS